MTVVSSLPLSVRNLNLSSTFFQNNTPKKHNRNDSTVLQSMYIGPGGLQLGHLANQVGWDYRIFDQAASAGSFFES